MISGALHFQEVQRFRQNRLVYLIGLGLVCGAGGTVAAATAGGPVGPALPLILGIFAGVGALAWAGQLRIEVRDDALYARLFPLTRQHRFSWSEIRSAEPVTYRPIRDYGGWGLRWGREGKAYNVSGNRGVQLEFQDGRRLLLGSQRADELAAAIREHLAR